MVDWKMEMKSRCGKAERSYSWPLDGWSNTAFKYGIPSEDECKYRTRDESLEASQGNNYLVGLVLSPPKQQGHQGLSAPNSSGQFLPTWTATR